MYCLKSINKRTLVSFSREDLNGWREYLGVASSGVIMIVLEYWAIQLVTLLTANLSANQFAAQSILNAVFGMRVIISHAFGNSMTTLIGNALGMNDH